MCPPIPDSIPGDVSRILGSPSVCASFPQLCFPGVLSSGCPVSSLCPLSPCSLLPSCFRSTRSRRSLSLHPWWSLRSCQGVSSPSSSHLLKSLQHLRAVTPPPSTGESLCWEAEAMAGCSSTTPNPASFGPSSYDGFPELRAELFESPHEQPGALPVPGPSRSAPSSPAPRRTKQVTEAPDSGRVFICGTDLIVPTLLLAGFNVPGP